MRFFRVPVGQFLQIFTMHLIVSHQKNHHSINYMNKIETRKTFQTFCVQIMTNKNRKLNYKCILGQLFSLK